MDNNVQKLRIITGAGVMDCHRALKETNGNFDEAVKFIHEKGLIKAQSREGRKTSAGLLESYIHNERVGVMLMINSETDFVAKSEPFRELSHNIVMHIAATAPKDVVELLNQPYVKDETITIGNLVKQVIAKTGENINISQFCRYEL